MERSYLSTFFTIAHIATAFHVSPSRTRANRPWMNSSVSASIVAGSFRASVFIVFFPRRWAMPLVYYVAPNVTAWCLFIFREPEIGGEG